MLLRYRLTRLFAPSLLFFALVCSSYAASLPASDEEWMGIYLLGQKVGYAHTKIGGGSANGPVHILNETIIRVALLGQSMEQKVIVNQDATPTGKPLTLNLKMSSGGHDTEVVAKYGVKDVRATLHSGGSTTEKVVPIPKGVTLDMDPDLMGKVEMPIGKQMSMYYFNPANLSIEKATMEVLRTESLTMGGIDYPATVIRTSIPSGEMTQWQDKDGHSLKVQAILGLTMLKETREAALSLPDVKYAPPADIGKAMAVDPGQKLDDPRKASMLKLRMTAPALPSPVADDRQKVNRVDADTVELTISAATLDPKGTLTLAEAARREPEWVKPGPYLPGDVAEVKKQAASILKGEKSAFWASQKLHDWVHQNMGVKADIGVIRSGLDVLKDRRGVCRDFAVLYTTLARAAGLPTRIATGMVYSEGAFYYHAWAESYVGKWIDVDPTLPSAFVDATHLKLLHGPAEAMFSAGKVMGQLKLKILDYRTGEPEDKTALKSSD